MQAKRAIAPVTDSKYPYIKTNIFQSVVGIVWKITIFRFLNLIEYGFGPCFNVPKHIICLLWQNSQTKMIGHALGPLLFI